jgi:hypothetical protein
MKEAQNEILQRVQEGKLTVEQAERLLAALWAARSDSPQPEAAPRDVEPQLDLPGAAPIASRAASPSITGAWSVELAQGIDMVHVTLRRTSAGGHSSSSFNLPFAALLGLTREALLAAGAPVRFELVRDAGRLMFEGYVNDGRGGGSFAFEPSAAFVDGMRALGYDHLSDERLFAMAVHDVSRAFVTELHALGYERLPVDQLIGMRIHGVTPGFIRELQALGYTRLPVNQLVSMRIHGVRVDFIESLGALGYERVPVDKLVAMRIHGVQIDFIRDLQRHGLDRVRVDQLIRMRIHGLPVVARG